MKRNLHFECDDGEDGELLELLYIEPVLPPASNPLIDEITQKMVGAFREATDSALLTAGFHECSCGACSTNTDYFLPLVDPEVDIMTNSLAIHYLAVHRHEVPQDHIEIVASFCSGLVLPTPEELQIPQAL